VISNKTIQQLSFYPVWVNQNAEPRFLSPDESGFQEVVDYMAKWCGELGTELRVSGDAVIVCHSE
jgi:hypothetical protein